MAVTLASTLINRALDNVSRLASTTTKNGTTLSDFGIGALNRVMQRMSRRHDFREHRKTYSTSTVDGQRTYALPTNYKTIYDLRVIDGSSSYKLEHSHGQYHDEKAPYPEGDSEGVPLFYMPYGNEMELYPIPDAIYLMYMRCTIWPATITAISDFVTYDSDKDDLLVAGMTEELFRLLQMHEDAGVWKMKFDEELRRAVDLDSKYPDWNPVGRGFSSSSQSRYIGGTPWNDPFVMED